MKIYYELSDLNEFPAWDGAERIKEIICNAGQGKNFITELENNRIFPNGCDETELNDFLRFDSDQALSLVDLEDNDKEEIE